MMDMTEGDWKTDRQSYRCNVQFIEEDAACVRRRVDLQVAEHVCRQLWIIRSSALHASDKNYGQH